MLLTVYLDKMFVQSWDGDGDRVELGLTDTVALDRLAPLGYHHGQTPWFAPHWTLADVLYLHLQVVHPLTCKQSQIFSDKLNISPSTCYHRPEVLYD